MPAIRCRMRQWSRRRRALDSARESVTTADTASVLLSGGASAMLAVPADGVTLDDKIGDGARADARRTRDRRLNCVRKHLSQIKGGRLGRRGGAA